MKEEIALYVQYFNILLEPTLSETNFCVKRIDFKHFQIFLLFYKVLLFTAKTINHSAKMFSYMILKMSHHKTITFSFLI